MIIPHNLRTVTCVNAQSSWHWFANIWWNMSEHMNLNRFQRCLNNSLARREVDRSLRNQKARKPKTMKEKTSWECCTDSEKDPISPLQAALYGDNITSFNSCDVGCFYCVFTCFLELLKMMTAHSIQKHVKNYSSNDDEEELYDDDDDETQVAELDDDDTQSQWTLYWHTLYLIARFLSLFIATWNGFRASNRTVETRIWHSPQWTAKSTGFNVTRGLEVNSNPQLHESCCRVQVLSSFLGLVGPGHLKTTVFGTDIFPSTGSKFLQENISPKA